MIAALPAPPGRRWLPVLIGAAVVVIAGVVLFAVWPRHHATKTSRVGAPPAAVPLNGTDRELIGLLQRGEKLTVHATYQASGPTGPIVLELWQQPPRVREDTTQTAGGQSQDTVTLTDGSINKECVRQGSGPLTCQTVGADLRRSIGLDGIITAFINALSGQPIAATASTFNGEAVHCYTVGARKLCVAADGLPVSIADQTVTYQLTARSAAVDPAAFTPPGA